MKLEETDYGIGVLEKDGSLKDAIIITKEALEKLRDEYIQKSKFEHKHDLELASFADSVRAEILNDILKHFDNGKEEV